MFAMNVLRHLHRLRRNQWLATAELEELQAKKLRSMIKFAYENVEFYHRRFDALGLKPSDIKTVDDLQKLPVTTRLDVQKNFPDGLLARGVSIENCTRHCSSGSTGMPVVVCGDAKTESYRAALFGRPFFECGLRLTDKMVRITEHSQQRSKWYEHLGLLRKVTISPKDQIESTLPQLENYRPDAIFGHSSYIYLLAKKLAEQQRYGSIMPRLAFTTAEVITPYMRKFIGSAFGAEVFDLYGCVEVERLAWECKEHAGYHMDIDSQVIEFVADNEHVAANESGQILVTCLYNYAMPLIRYDLGDVGVPSDEKCPCGRGLPLMKNVEGRINDFVQLPDGRTISPMTFLCLDGIKGISQFRVTQTKKDKILVEIVLDEHDTTETVHKSHELIEDIVGSSIHVEVMTKNRLSSEKSGKFRNVRSFLNNDKLY